MTDTQRGQTTSFQHTDDSAYVQPSGMTFGTVLDLLHGGQRARRPDWPDDDFIYLVQGSTFTVNRPPLSVIFPSGTEVQYAPHIDYHRACHETQTHHCSVWTPSQIDILATDWLVTA